MSDNLIYTSDGDVIGFYNDLHKSIIKEIKNAVKKSDFDILESYIEILKELENNKQETGLLKVSENNGMGLTVSPLPLKED